MAKGHPPEAPELRRRMVELVRAGGDPADLAREFEPSSQAIRNWVAQADRQEGRREVEPAADAGLSVAEREELTRLRRENKQLRLERDILSVRPLSCDGLVRPRDRRDPVRLFGFMSANQAVLSDRRDGTRARRVAGPLLRPAPPPALGPCPSG